MTFEVGQPGPFATHRNALRDGRFLLQRSRSSGQFCFPPRPVAPGTGEDDLEWVEASGLGEVYALTVIPRKPERGGDYNIALVELAEGPRMMTRIVGIDPSGIAIGMKVRARIAVPDFDELKGGDQPVVLFEPLAQESGA